MRVSRIKRLARLPIFVSLTGKRAVVAGDGPAAAWKAELLAAAGATVDVYAPDPDQDLLGLVDPPAPGCIALHRRRWLAGDFHGATMAVGAIVDEAEAARFAAAARAAGVCVNIVDNAKHGDFSFGSIVARSPLVIGISTDGAAPAFAQSVRGWLEALIPVGFSRWAQAAHEWRPRLRSLGFPPAVRRRFWRRFAERAHLRCAFTPGDADFDELTAMALREEAQAAPAVRFHGIASNDPDHLRLGDLRALQTADVIFADDCISSEILAFARREALIVPLNGGDDVPEWHSDICALMVDFARRRNNVLRLAASEAMVSARIAAEMSACRAAGLRAAVMPQLGSNPPRAAAHRPPPAAPWQAWTQDDGVIRVPKARTRAARGALRPGVVRTKQ